jgi:hypothetical protein
MKKYIQFIPIIGIFIILIHTLIKPSTADYLDSDHWDFWLSAIVQAISIYLLIFLIL